MKPLVLIITLVFCTPIFAYELLVIQGVSKEKQTFVVRNTDVGNKDIFEGQKATFTSDNVAIIAKALTVTNEFVQWEIMNDYTDTPFTQGEIVTMHDAREHLWALTPEVAKKKYFRRTTYRPRRSIEGQFFFSKGVSESYSGGGDAQNINRGGVHIEGSLRTEISMNFTMSYGLRYVREVANLADASLINTRFLGVVEGRYYFPPMIDFYNARIGLGLGAGYGQTRSEITGSITSGNAVLLPSTKISLMLPIDYENDFEFVAAFESVRLDEQDANETEQTTNIIISKAGIIYRRHL